MLVKVRDGAHTYSIRPVENNPRASSGDSSDSFMYRVDDENDEGIGCITFSWSGTARAVATGQTYRNSNEEELAYLALIPYLPFFPEKISNLYQNQGYTCFKYMFNTGVEGLAENGFGYSIKLEGGFKRTAQRIMFGGSPTNDQIRRQILTTLYNYWSIGSQEVIGLEMLGIFVPVDKVALERNVEFLGDDDRISFSKSTAGYHHIKIKNEGIKFIEDQSEFSIKVPYEFVYQKIMGNQINASTKGNYSPVIVDSHNINIAFNEIKSEVQKQETPNKSEVLQLIDSLNAELSTGGSPEKVKGILDRLKSSAVWVNEKILSHPLLSQAIVQALAKYTGIL